MPLFNRLINISLGGVSFAQGLRINFRAVKTTETSSNELNLSIYNLATNTRNQLSDFNDLVVVSAGYSEYEGAKVCFIGSVTFVNHAFRSPDVLTQIEAGDGLESLRERRASFSYSEGVSSGKVLQDIASEMGLTIRTLSFAATDTYLQGFSYSGSVKTALDKVTERLGLEWSIQGNQLQIIEKDGVVNMPPLVISRNTGLISKVERLKDIKSKMTENAPKPGYQFTTLLNGSIEPGMQVLIQDGVSNGVFRVEQVIHKGDNFDGDFITECKVVELIN